MSVGVRVWSSLSGQGEDALQDRTEAKQEAFAGLVARHSRLMFRVAYGLLRNAHDAEDAVQEAFLKLYRNDTWQAITDEKAFLARTVWRIALDRLPPAQRQMEDITELDLTSPTATPEQTASEADERELLRMLMDGLPLELREALVLSALDGLNSREVAFVLAIPEGTVRTRLMRARTELKKRFEALKGGRA